MLKQEELIHSHILVAIFCGWEAQKPNKEFPNGYLWMRESDEDTHWISNDNVLEEIPYATDWNYLLVAYDKYRTEAEDQADEGPTPDFEASKAVMDIRDTLIDAILDVNIDLAFKELVRGVEYINSLKLQES